MVVFIPVALLAGTLVSAISRVAVAMLPDIVEFIVCGAFGAAATIIIGLRVAPKRTAAVKWTLITITALLGALAAVGALLGADKLQVVIGISTFLVALGCSSLHVNDIANATSDALGGMVITAAELDRWASGKIVPPEERERIAKYMALSDAQKKAQIDARFARRDFTIAEREWFNSRRP